MSFTRHLQSKYVQLVHLLDSRPTTERALIFVTASLVIFMLVFMAIVSPLEKASISIQKNIEIKQAEKALLDQEILILTESLRQAPKESKLMRLEELRIELNSTGEFSELMKDLITPREMVRFVEGVLSSNNDIIVVRVKNMPATQLWPDPTITRMDSTEAENTIKKNQQPLTENEFSIYKHGMLLEVKGRYRELISFFMALEKLPWKILWGNVSLTTDDNSDSVATLVIYTLSTDKAWMGL